MSVEAIVFDFDGLLMDTESSMLASWQHVWSAHGLELDVTTFWVDHGGDVTEERYARLAEAVGPGFDRDAAHRRRTAYRDALHASLGFRSGIPEWLTRAPELTLAVAIASSSPRHWVAGHLERLGCLGQFRLLACGDEVRNHKPDPAVYRLALSRLAVDADHAIAVEDSPHGVHAARAAGMKCVAIPNPHVDPSRLAHADLVLGSATERTLDGVIQDLGFAAAGG